METIKGLFFVVILPYYWAWACFTERGRGNSGHVGGISDGLMTLAAIIIFMGEVFFFGMVMSIYLLTKH